MTASRHIPIPILSWKNSPTPSGPRAAMLVRKVLRTSLSTPSFLSMMPRIPHIVLLIFHEPLASPIYCSDLSIRNGGLLMLFVHRISFAHKCFSEQFCVSSDHLIKGGE